MSDFNKFKLKDTTFEFIKLNGFNNPSKVQEKVIPKVLEGKDIIGLSATGSGKTHSYLIPILDKIDTSLNEVQAVITAPTRELAVQIFEMANMILKVDDTYRIKLYIGGKDKERDKTQLSKEQASLKEPFEAFMEYNKIENDLKEAMELANDKELGEFAKEEPHIAIGTPGRIKDLFLNEGLLRIDKAKILVVDEADMTLEYGFLDEIDAFAGRMSDELQMLSFSATMPDQLAPFIKKYMHHPLTITVEDDTKFSPNIKHVLVPCYHHEYADVILSMIKGIQAYICVIFANTREEVGEIASKMRAEGISVTEIHGGLTSRQRKQAMKIISSGEAKYVVATDLAARGIDIGEISHVISCGFPDELEFYVHRSGRASRAGTSGTSYALYKTSDDASIRALKRRGIKFEHMRYRKTGWQVLKPYGAKKTKTDVELKKEISKLNTKKNQKVKPGYKKKREREIARLKQKKKRELIRSKIREEKKAMYKERARKKYEESGD